MNNSNALFRNKENHVPVTFAMPQSKPMRKSHENLQNFQGKVAQKRNAKAAEKAANKKMKCVAPISYNPQNLQSGGSKHVNCNLASVPSTMKTKSTRHIRAFRSKNGKMMTSEELFAFQARKRLFKEANKMMKNNRNTNANKKKESR